MPDTAALWTAFNDADYAEVLRLLDVHYGANRPNSYGNIRQNIEYYLNQGLMPMPAIVQGLEHHLNSLSLPQPGHPGPFPAPDILQANVPTHWDAFFQNKSFKKSLTLWHTVNCNRRDYYDQQIAPHFEAHKDRPGNLLYLIAACRTQKPESISKRLAYWFEDELQVRLSPADERRKDEVEFPELPLGKKAEQTFAHFWKLIQTRLLQASAEWEDFRQKPAEYLPALAQTRVLLTFRIEEQDFRDFGAAKHLAYLMEQLAALPEEYQQFVCCFAFFMDELHSQRGPDCRLLLDELDQLAQQIPQQRALHLSGLPPAPKGDFQIWWNAFFDHHTLPHALQRLQDATATEKQTTYQQQACFDMETIEDLQYAAYLYNRDQY